MASAAGVVVGAKRKGEVSRAAWTYLLLRLHLCWVHRALKEAGRLSAGRLDTGHDATLVRRSHEAHRPRALTSMLTGADDG